MKLTDFLRYLANRTGISVVADASIQDRGVSLSLNGQPIDEVLEAVSRHLGVEVHKQTPTLYFVGALREGDKAILVRRVRGLSAEELDKAVRPVLSQSNSVATFEDGLLVLSDRAPIVQRISRMLDQIESTRAGTWAVQLYFVTLSTRDLLELGLDVEPSFGVGVNYSSASANPANALKLEAGLNALLAAVQERKSAELIAQPFFYLRDGSTAKYERVRSIPIPTVQVSEETGQRTVVGFQAFEAGTIVRATIRERSTHAILLELDAELTAILSINAEGQPDANRQRIEGESVLQSGGVYLLSSVQIDRKLAGRRSLLKMGVQDQTDTETLQVWARAVAVDGEGKE